MQPASSPTSVNSADQRRKKIVIEDNAVVAIHFEKEFRTKCRHITATKREGFLPRNRKERMVMLTDLLKQHSYR
jgi:hypothetical protein